MIFLAGYLLIGLGFWARGRFCSEFLERSDWGEVKRGGGVVEHVNERDWKSWIAGSVIHLIFWPVLLVVLMHMLINHVMYWIYKKVIE